MSKLRASTGLLLGAMALVTTPAIASPSFPITLKDQLRLSKAPSCSLCHLVDEDGGAAPAGDAGGDTPFARSLLARGLMGGDDASLRRALDAMRDVDSDGDGARDLDELGWGGDPNRADKPEVAPGDPPSYGCGATVARRGERTATGAAAMFWVLLLAGRRSGGRPDFAGRRRAFTRRPAGNPTGR